MHATRADGSSQDDRGPQVIVDKGSEPERWRYRCPRGHTDWEPWNSHGWCRSCARQSRHQPDVDPEIYEIVDDATGESIAWSRVRVLYP